MTKKEGNNFSLALSIFGAGLVIALSVVYFSFNSAPDYESEEFEEAVRVVIDDVIDEQTAEYEKSVREAQGLPSEPETIDEDLSDDDPFLGDENAPITIVEFSDYECPFCGRFYSNTLSELKERFVETGQVKFVYRDFPLSSHPGAYPSALFAECTRDQLGNEAYFSVHDKLFENLNSGVRFNYEDMAEFADSLAVDQGELKECFDSDKFEDEIYGDLDDARAIGVSGTPTFIVGNQILKGAQPIEEFEAAIEAQLEE